jgi:vacuolar-type H+-ATPase subunit I/STV1
MIESDEDDDGDRKPSLTARLEIFNRVQAIQPQREEGQARLDDAKAEKASRAVLKRRQHAHNQQQHCQRKYKKREQDIVYPALQRQYHADPPSTVAEQLSAWRDLLGTVRQLQSRKRQADIAPNTLQSVRRDMLNECKRINTVAHQGIDSCKQLKLDMQHDGDALEQSDSLDEVDRHHSRCAERHIN